MTLEWWSRAWHNPGARSALATSVKAGLGATAIALVLGTMAAFAVGRYRFFGRESISILVVLPIALPGIVTGIALSNAITTTLEPVGIKFGLFTGDRRARHVLHRRGLQQRAGPAAAHRRLARGGLDRPRGGACSRPSGTSRFPVVRSALLAGGLLAFALSFDEIIVTTFTAGASVQTLPLWIFSNLSRPNQAPVVNVVAAVLILASVIPVWLAQRLSSDTAGGRL